MRRNQPGWGSGRRIHPLRVPALSVETGGGGTTTPGTPGTPGTNDKNEIHADTERLILEGISIDPNGVITGTSGKTIYSFGQVAVCNVPNQEALEKVGDSYYKIKGNTGTCGGYVPGEGSTGDLVTNALEMSKTDLAQEITNCSSGRFLFPEFFQCFQSGCSSPQKFHCSVLSA